VKPRNATELAIVCFFMTIAIVAIVIGVAVVAVKGDGPVAAGVAVAAAAGAALVAWARAVGTRRNAKAELTSGERYRGLADEYRRLSDLAITAQEHTDLKLGDVGVQLDYLREQMESMQKILKEVE
jgi:membrane protein implicated in regulation of membrane protease activity